MSDSSFQTREEALGISASDGKPISKINPAKLLVTLSLEMHHTRDIFPFFPSPPPHQIGQGLYLKYPTVTQNVSNSS